VRLLIKNRRSPYAWIFNDIVGAGNFRGGKTATLSGFKIVDEQRFEIRLDRKNGNFTKYLCFPAAAVVPSTESDFKKPMGTGPFRVSSFKPNGRIVLAAFDRYHNGRPFIDHAIFEPVRMDEAAASEFTAGNIHITDIPLDGLRPGAASPETTAGTMNILYFLDVDSETPPLNSESGRGNVSRALNRIDLLNTVLSGRGRTETNFKAGTAKKASAKKELTLRYPDTGAAYKLAAEKLRRDLNTAGMKVSLEPCELRALFHFPRDNPPDLVLRALPVMLDLPESVENVLYSANLETEHAALALRINAKNAARDARDKNLAIYVFSQPTAYTRASELRGFSLGRFNNIDLQNIHIGTPSE
jgi:ABC-type oligopeptide transport system substrate-binding subunit